MKINKTQFRIIYYMYNRNEYNTILSNLKEQNAALGLVERFPEVFKATSKGFRELWFSITSLEDIFKLIKYNQNYEKEM